MAAALEKEQETPRLPSQGHPSEARRRHRAAPDGGVEWACGETKSEHDRLGRRSRRRAGLGGCKPSPPAPSAGRRWHGGRQVRRQTAAVDCRHLDGLSWGGCQTGWQQNQEPNRFLHGATESVLNYSCQVRYLTTSHVMVAWDSQTDRMIGCCPTSPDGSRASIISSNTTHPRAFDQQERRPAPPPPRALRVAPVGGTSNRPRRTPWLLPGARSRLCRALTMA